MILPFIAGVIVTAVVLLFALQNSAPASVAFFRWSYTGPLALILCLTFVLGAAVAFLGMLPELVRLGWKPFRRNGKTDAGAKAGGETPVSHDPEGGIPTAP